MTVLFLNKTQFRFVSRFPCLTITLVVYMLAFCSPGHASHKLAHGGSQRAVVVDERLAVLRDGPGLSARLLKRLSRGRKVSILNTKRSRDGIMFHRVAVTRRTRGWIQVEAVVSPGRNGDDERLLSLIRGSTNFDRISRACIFLETFSRSTVRPTVLLILGEAAENATVKLSSDAAKRLDEAEMKANRAQVFSYFMNFNGLDRYRRLGVDFVFDDSTKQYHYDGKCWRELVRRYPKSVEAIEARRRLDSSASKMSSGKSEFATDRR